MSIECSIGRNGTFVTIVTSISRLRHDTDRERTDVPAAGIVPGNEERTPESRDDGKGWRMDMPGCRTSVGPTP